MEKYESNHPCETLKKKLPVASPSGNIFLSSPPLSLTHHTHTLSSQSNSLFLFSFVFVIGFHFDLLPTMLRTAATRASSRAIRPQHASKSFFSTTSAPAALSPYSRVNGVSRNKSTEIPRNQSTAAAV